MTGYEAVIGIETHVELRTRSKMFCGCAVGFGAPPNTNVCPVCLGLPGALPVPNQEAIEGILQIGAALKCAIVEHSLFHRKNYFYPDLPKNYQISQYDVPLCVDGHLDVDVDGETARIGITRVHMEEDTGKSLHGSEGGRIHDAAHSLLDFNRSGVPLVEIVSEPDIRSPEEARAYATELQQIVRSLGVTDARLEEGSMRFDANVSVRPVGQEEFGTRAEVKNMNSLRSLQRAVAFEIDRQIQVVESGANVVQETRHWNESTGVTSSMRSKEESEDYRYFQEPDLVPLEVDAAWQARVRASLPELPAERKARYVDAGVDEATAASLVADTRLGDLFDEAVAAGADGKAAGNWITGEIVAYLRQEDVDLDATGVTAGDIVALHQMVGDGAVSASAAKDVLRGVLAGEGRAPEVAEARDLLQISDSDVIEAEVDAILAAHPDELARMKQGDMKPMGYLVGQVMRATKGKADPRQVSELLRARAAG
ncbi:MAG TPA: Asp-tRNA(Asn)/Glu-tRNA(Gln) amidotransferase subunit GatB [Acidimicrobiia bacterium]|jgi:aspartyl-tRNA(Asn)/glutamyl-tRNA(Gln) amidotransferase subunit B|nr:Asp-tRNA(Asn)/Glu-tRNA(Gln) amidotransferase subunit GatB [Acidimicrobiia bacterium]